MFGISINRINEIERTATEVWRRCSGGSLPVSTRKIIFANSIFLHHANAESEFCASFDLTGGHPPYDLYLRDRRPGESEIPYNRRLRFTEAHELGHFFLHLDRRLEHREDYTKVVVACEAGNFQLAEIEIEANTFGGALLMPRDVFKHGLEASQIRGGGNWRGTLVRKYDVSYEALDVRVARLRDGLFISGYAWENTGKIEMMIPNFELEIADPVIAMEAWRCNPVVEGHVVRYIPANLLRDLRSKLCKLGDNEVATAKDEKENVFLRSILPNVGKAICGNIYFCGCYRRGRKIYFEIELTCV